MRWLLRRCGQSAVFGNGSSNSFSPSRLGFSEVRRSLVTSCRAVLLQRFGGPEVLELRDDVGIPDLKPNEVLVRARAVSVNPLDCRMREGYGRSLFEPLLPLILGRDVSGEVAAVGSTVRSLSIGQEVFGALHPTAVRGTYVDYAILAEDELVRKPESISHVHHISTSAIEVVQNSHASPRLPYIFSSFIWMHFALVFQDEASAIPFAALTAWRALRSTADIKEGYVVMLIICDYISSLDLQFFITNCTSFKPKGRAFLLTSGSKNGNKTLDRQRVLVLGGGGAVGFSAIQLAVAYGCHVCTTCGSESISRMLEAGAEQAVDYAIENYEVSLKGYFDAVLDTIGVPETERIGVNVLKRGGHYMTLQGESASLTDKYGLMIGLPMSTAILLKKQMQYRYSHGIEYHWTYMRSDDEGLEEIRRLSEAGKLKVPVEKTFPIAQVREAHEAKDKRLIFGKVVLELD
ncbi:zinc binding dehydrogenase [Striga asiatica]|uniref:Zinc binding dehydrogenase n=1 Tax=Striga asiatica TaxID=4170 RepID=A0A5A7RBY6_STRAF|nr:zinc binding dehydrogenase [Striga asiatica]